MLVHDGTRIYGLAVVRCDAKKLRAKALKRDDRLKGDSQIELVFADDETEYSVRINPLGTIHDTVVRERNSNQKADDDWGPVIEVASGFGTDYWVAEFTLPVESMTSIPSTALGLNIKIHTEDVKATWVKDGLGKMEFVHETTEIWTTNVDKIDIEGDEPINRDEILGLIGFVPGDDLPIDRLELVANNLLLTGFFDGISFEVESFGDKTNLIVKPVTAEVYRPSNIEVSSALDLLSEDRIRDLFEPLNGVIPKKRADIVRKMIETSYRENDHDYVRVTLDQKENILAVVVKQGVLTQLEIKGNRLIRNREIESAFGDLPMVLDDHMHFENRIKDLEQVLDERSDHFKGIRSWELQEIPGGYSLALSISEEKAVSSKVLPVFDFNRVHGTVLGTNMQLKSRLLFGERIYGDFRYGFSSEVWNYNFGAEKGLAGKELLSVGGHVYRLTDSSDRWRISNLENLLAEFILGKSYRDFYERKGWEVYSVLKLFKRFRVVAGYTDETHDSMRKITDWYLLREDDNYRARITSSRYDWHLADQDTEKSENPPIDEGQMRSLWVRCYLDLRDKHKTSEHDFFEKPVPNWRTRNGWLLYGGVETTGENLDSDFDFTKFDFMIARYNQIGRNRLDLRFMGSYVDSERVIPEQRRPYLGGLGSLRGYAFKEFSDDAVLLLNAEYGLKMIGGLWVNPFFDIAYLWYLEETYASIGLGLSAGPIRVNFAQALDNLERETVVSLRIDRLF
jgi:hypothetical protein